MAGHCIYAFDWDLFEDLTTNPKSKLPAKIADKLAPAKGQQPQGLASKLPASKPEAARVIADLFLNPEWFADQPQEAAQWRQELLVKLLLDSKLKSIGLSVKSTCREDTVAYEVPLLLAGALELDLARMTRPKSLYFKRSNKPPKQQNIFHLFGSRPYRHGQWTGSTEEQDDFEQTFRRPTHSVHSKPEVREMLATYEAALPQYKAMKNKRLSEMLSDLQYSLNTAIERDAGIFVDNDY